MESSPDRYGLLSVTANLGLAVLKIVTGMVGNAYALIADGIESIADVFSSLIVWRGLHVAQMEPDREHPYGHGKAESIGGFVAAAALLVSAGVIAWNAVAGILEPGETPALFTLPVLALIILIKESLYRWLRGRSRLHDSHALAVEAFHHRSDALTSLGVFIGIGIAVFGGPRFAAADDVAALLVSFLIAFNALRLLRPSIDELMDRRVEGERVQKIHAHAATVPGILRLETVHLRKAGNRYLVDLHLEVDGSISVRQGHALAHALRHRLENDASLRIIWVSSHVEPADEEAIEENPL